MMALPIVNTHRKFSCETKWFARLRAFRQLLAEIETRARRDKRAISLLLDFRAATECVARLFHVHQARGVAMSGPCFVCGKPNSPFGYGWPGLRRDKPEGKRGYLWTCGEHREDGERRRDAAIGDPFGRKRPQSTTPTKHEQKGPTDDLPKE